MSFDEWDNHPDTSDIWGVWNNFSAIPMNNIPELERFMERNQLVLFYPATANIGRNLTKGYSPETDARYPNWKAYLDLLESAKIIGIPAAIEKLRKRR